jgi:hypothetical protein
MPQVELLKIFLASPSDVAKERDHVVKVINDINSTIAPRQGVRLQVVRSEENVFPGYNPEGGQAELNAQIANMGEYALFVGIMWNRVGTPTPRAESGTIEEFERAVEAFKSKRQPDIWFYFREASARFDKLEELEQRQKVLKFRGELQRKALIRPYKNPSNFREEFHRHITLWLNQRENKTSQHEWNREPSSKDKEILGNILKEVQAPSVVTGISKSSPFTHQESRKRPSLDIKLIDSQHNDSFVELFGGGTGIRFTVRNLKLNGEGNTLTLEQGGSVEATLEINHDCSECGGAINQIIVGLAGEDRAQACVWIGGSSSNGWQTVSFSLNIPAAWGVYYIRTRYAQAYNEQDALGWWTIDRPNGPTEEANIGVIVVQGNVFELFAGEYICAVKWGGDTGTWREGTEHLIISEQGEVQFRSRFPATVIQNLKVDGNTLSWSAEDNETAAEFTFKEGSEDRYFWEDGQSGKLFEGWLQYPNEGRIDFRGRRDETPVINLQTFRG